MEQNPDALVRELIAAMAALSAAARPRSEESAAASEWVDRLKRESVDESLTTELMLELEWYKGVFADSRGEATYDAAHSKACGAARELRHYFFEVRRPDLLAIAAAARKSRNVD